MGVEVFIRTARADDAAAFAAIYEPFVTSTHVSFEETPPDAAELGRRVAATLERLPWLTAVRGDEVVGFAYASAHRSRAAYRWAVDVSAYVRDGARGRGIGSDLYAALFGVLGRQGFRRAYAGVALPNAASVAFHRRAGFMPVGTYRGVGWKFGAWHDVAWFERILGDDPDAPPAEPLPFAAELLR